VYQDGSPSVKNPATLSEKEAGGPRFRKKNAVTPTTEDGSSGEEGATVVNRTRPNSLSDLEEKFAGEGGKPWSERSYGYQFMPFRGMYYDVKARLPYYVNDWVEGFKPKNLYRIFAASIRMYFIKYVGNHLARFWTSANVASSLLPAIAYVLDMRHRTDGAYSINEVLLASALAAIVFPIFSVQPLTIVGVTGLINLFNYTDYTIVVEHWGIDYLQFQAWMLM
jgi:hypothetical protein